uniref:uncharacterized protein LOC122587801 n=1 Tax=Erigeron canadensis TaxID=72917 RepID=UPI001CB9732D|nr:uncharacterized protein LOC122587801 [Erigeron canadensis]
METCMGILKVRGLRQGDPMSSYLFTLVMEVLTLLLQYVSSDSPFTFHHQCVQQSVINVCFADDLFLFAHGDLDSAKVVMDALNVFKDMSGLTPNLPKSTIFFCNVSDRVKNAILDIMPFEEDQLSVKYLGVHLISTRLVYKDCAILIERMEKKITNWLYFAGRLQLINSVLISMHTYWASVFILPTRILHELERKMRGFLWCQGVLVKGKAKVAWKSVCTPKYEGDLGKRHIFDLNNALIEKHVWSILNNRESLWVKWVHSYRLKGRNFWDFPFQSNVSWGWRKLLQLHPIIRPFIWSKLGDGCSTSVWFDKWFSGCPLRDFLSPRDISRAGFVMSSSVADLVDNGSWKWPNAWLDSFQVLQNCTAPNLTHGRPDSLIWSNSDGKELDFSASNVWDMIRVRKEQVVWVNVVWFSMSPDSHAHFFFRCIYSTTVWTLFKDMAGLGHVLNTEDTTDYLIPISKGKSAKSVIGRLVHAAAVYFIWQERNNRMFTNNMRPPERLKELIVNTVRMRLASVRFKANRNVLQLLEIWKLPKSLLMDGDDPSCVT